MPGRTILIALALMLAIAGAGFFLSSTSFGEFILGGASDSQPSAEELENLFAADSRADSASEWGEQDGLSDADDSALSSKDSRSSRKSSRNGAHSSRSAKRADGSNRSAAERLSGRGANGESAAGSNADASLEGEVGEESAQDKDLEAAEAGEEQAKLVAILTGSVTDDAGAAIVDAQVFIEGASFARTVKSDAGGNFQVPGVPSGESYDISATKAGYHRNASSFKSVSPKSAGPNAIGELKLDRAMTIGGSVVQSDKSPAGAARVRLYQRMDGGRFNSLSTKVTGGDGRFLFDRLGDGEYRLEVEHAGHSGKFENNIRAPREIDIALENASAIEGRVIDEVGEPITNASVLCELFAEPDLHFSSRTRSGSDGSFKVECPPGSVHNTLTVTATGYATKKLPLVAAGKKIDVQLVPNDNAVVRGTVAFGDGSYPDALTVRVDALLDGKRTAAQKAFTFSGQAAARFELEFLPLDGGTHTLKITGTSFKPITLQLGDVRKREVIELGEIFAEGGLKLAGHVRIGDAKGKPAVGARVVLANGVSDKTDSTGAFKLLGLEPESKVLLTMQLDGFPLGYREVTIAKADITNLVLIIPYGDRMLSGVVLSAADKSPIAGASVKIVGEGAPAVLTDESGNFFIDNALAENLKLRVSHPEFATKEIDAISFHHDEGIAESLRVELVPGAAIFGTISKAIDGAPVRPEVSVKIYRGSSLVTTAKTDIDGSYATQPLEAGEYFVEVPEFRIPAKPVSNPGKQGVQHDMVTRATIRVTGKVLTSTGAPHGSAGIYVYSFKHAGVFDTIYTDPSGEFEIDNMWPGTFSLSILKHPSDQAAQWVREIEVAEGLAEQHMVVQLPPSNAVIEGRVTYENGEPVAGARVSMTNTSCKMARAVLAAYTVTDAQGFYRATRLQENMSFEVRVGGYADNARTGLTFAETTVTGGAGSIRTANIVCPQQGFSVRVKTKRADGGPLIREVTSILYDEQGRRAGNFFGATVDLFDLVPGRYELKSFSAGMQAASVTLVVNEGGSYALIGGDHLEFELDPEFG